MATAPDAISAPDQRRSGACSMRRVTSLSQHASIARSTSFCTIAGESGCSPRRLASMALSSVAWRVGSCSSR
jgi:hypothetical protein